MNVLKRALISMKRKPKKSFLLLGLVFILGTFISATVFISQAINNTEANILSRIPPVTTITATGRDIDDINPELMLSFDKVQEISQLPQISEYDFFRNQRGVTTQELIYWEDEKSEESRWIDSDLGIELDLRAIQNPKLVDEVTGLINLVEGRHFSEKEMIQITDTIPVIVANDIAEINALSVGSTFEAEQVIWKMVETSSIFTESGTSYSDDRTQSHL